jgi:hypothetical protein
MTLQPLHRPGDPIPATDRVYEPGVYRLLDAAGTPAGQLAVNLLSLQETELGDVPTQPVPTPALDGAVAPASPPAPQGPPLASGLPPTDRGDPFPWQSLLLLAVGLVVGEWAAQPLVQLWDRRRVRLLEAKVQSQRAAS